MQHGYLIGEYPQFLSLILSDTAVSYFHDPYAVINQYIATVIVLNKPLSFRVTKNKKSKINKFYLFLLSLPFFMQIQVFNLYRFFSCFQNFLKHSLQSRSAGKKSLIFVYERESISLSLVKSNTVEYRILSW